MPELVSIVTCACNQADWVRKTIPKMRESLNGIKHEIIVVNDQSQDGCCDGLDSDVQILETPTRYGVSKSRRLGVSAAVGDIFLFTDPHCEYPDHALQHLVELARDKDAIIEPRTTGRPVVRRARFGGVLTRSDRGLKVSYATRRPADWPALLGSIYCVKRTVYDYLGGWPELPGVWGYSEQAFTLMSWFLGVPIVIDECHTCNHEHYHPNNKFSYHVPLKDQANNGHWVHAAFFPKMYHTDWAPTLKARFRNHEEYWASLSVKDIDEEGNEKLRIDAFREYIKQRAVRTERDFYEMVLGEKYPQSVEDEAFLNQQRRRSKPKIFPTIHARQDRALRWFVRNIPVPIKGSRIVDLGTRDGHIVDELTKMEAALAEGIELVPETAEFARSIGRNVVCGDMRRTTYKDGSWDLVTCIHSLEHVPDPTVALEEIFRILKPGGWLLIVVPVESSPTSGAAHNCCFPNEHSLIAMVSQFDVTNIKSEIKSLHRGHKEIVLLAQRKANA